ncbi:MAG TPA: trigger factor [Actinomycetota bacterium]|nr:trigger factor [Actinomycetota bacterium]
MPQTLTTTAERIGKDRVKLRIEVGEDALRPAIDAAYRRWSQQIRVPGFRKGKVPRALIDSHVGPGAVRAEAIEDALPGLLRDALKENDLEAIAPADIDNLEGVDGEGPLVFEATVDVRPEITIPDLSSIEVEAPPSEITDEDVDEQLERLRDRFAELESVSREARTGDFVLMDLKGYRHDQPVEGASAPDYLYEVGSQTGPPKLDAELGGAKAGTILKFTDEVHIHREDEPEHDHSSMDEISFTVLVKEVKTKKLPPLDEDFAKTVGEFESLDALKDDLRTRLVDVKKGIVEQEVRSKVLEAFVEAIDLEPPEKLVESEFDHRLEHFEDELKRSGATLDDDARQAQLTELEIRRDIREQAGRSVKADLLLEEVARTQELNVGQDDLAQEIAMLAARMGRDPKEVADQLVQGGRLNAVAADVLRRKALDWVVGNVKVIGLPSDAA